MAVGDSPDGLRCPRKLAAAAGIPLSGTQSGCYPGFMLAPRRDHLVRAIVHGPDVRVVTAFTTATARLAEVSHECAPTSAALLAQGLTAGVLLASVLEKER